MLSAINRPFQQFDGKELYPSIYEKAAAIAESIIGNHPFLDGNKRTGLVVMYALLLENNIRLHANSDELYAFIISISTGNIDLENIIQWLKQHSTDI